MQTKSKYNLQRTMIIYFLLIGMASFMLGFEFWLDFREPQLGVDASVAVGTTNGSANPYTDAFDRMRLKALVMAGTVMVVTLIVLTMFIRNISDPLQHMIDLAREISAGDLSHTVDIQADNELSELGHIINEMASNLQEILMLSRNFCTSGKDLIGEAQGQFDGGQALTPENVEKLRALILQLDTEITELGEVVEFFNFYTGEQSADDARLDG